MMLLWGTGVLTAIGCGSGSGADSGSSSSGSTQNTYQKPPSIYDKPPSSPKPGTDYEKPPSIYEPAPGSGPSGGSAVCQKLCNSAELLQCLVQDGAGEGGIGNVPSQIDPSVCTQDCSAALDDAPCGPELAAMADCLFSTIEITCELFGKLQGGDVSGLDPQALQACEQAAEAFNSCSQSMGSEVDGGNGTGGGNGNGNGNAGRGNGTGGTGAGACTMPACTGCTDNCATCECAFGVGSSNCAPIC
ncbi:MAG TPA: hypothetical protein VGQ57_17745 [Polyangiaceae bacterium]|jgi:hypothetical protein|nr:hypothetical protein [Polyangiaceae bacterium]